MEEEKLGARFSFQWFHTILIPLGLSLIYTKAALPQRSIIADLHLWNLDELGPATPASTLFLCLTIDIGPYSDLSYVGVNQEFLYWSQLSYTGAKCL